MLLALGASRSHAQVATNDAGGSRTVTITFDGPATSESAEPNPFLSYRLDVTFSNQAGGASYVVPGYFAGDGNAGQTGAEAGNRWRVHFTPDRAGVWTYRASFRTGAHIALSSDLNAGTPVAFDGATGSFAIGALDSTAGGFARRGLLRYVGERYLRFDDGTYFLKGGADSPENLLGYFEFDGTEPGPRPLHRYQPHVRDWRAGDPLWRDGRGRGIIGALDYLASKGMNSVYFLTMNVEGDGQDVWPWTSRSERERFDLSKLDQWNLVFDHMDRLGLLMHVVLTETENESLFEYEATRAAGAEPPRTRGRSSFADTRKLYYRELIARFGYHPAVVWNLGEENGWDEREPPGQWYVGAPNTDAQRVAFASYIRELDPYDHPIVVHTLPGGSDTIYPPLLAETVFDGASLQLADMRDTHAETLEWVARSAAAGRPWVVSIDEIGPAGTGVMPDGPNSNQDDVRHYALWGNLMAGGAGAEWYFGYEYPHNDLNLEDWRSRDRLWDYTRHALRFFRSFLPFTALLPADSLTPATDDYVLARAGEIYAVYLPPFSRSSLVIPEGGYTVQWVDARDGGPLRDGSVRELRGPGTEALGDPPDSPDQDWVALVRSAAR